MNENHTGALIVLWGLFMGIFVLVPTIVSCSGCKPAERIDFNHYKPPPAEYVEDQLDPVTATQNLLQGEDLLDSEPRIAGHLQEYLADGQLDEMDLSRLAEMVQAFHNQDAREDSSREAVEIKAKYKQKLADLQAKAKKALVVEQPER